eukprot:6187744-Pleurochrysis_carterae.AAC.7
MDTGILDRKKPRLASVQATPSPPSVTIRRPSVERAAHVKESLPACLSIKTISARDTHHSAGGSNSAKSSRCGRRSGFELHFVTRSCSSRTQLATDWAALRRARTRSSVLRAVKQNTRAARARPGWCKPSGRANLRAVRLRGQSPRKRGLWTRARAAPRRRDRKLTGNTND